MRATGAEAPAERHLLRSNSLLSVDPVPGIGRLQIAAFAAGADAMGTRSDAAGGRRPRENPVLLWALAQRRSPGDLLEFVEASARRLGASPGSRGGRGSAARALFVEYARGQGLSCGELAMLLGDADAMASEALVALERRAKARAKRPRWRHPRRARSP